jgi:23S rRNA-/tRNA-specific pseudouridylate synthase
MLGEFLLARLQWADAAHVASLIHDGRVTVTPHESKQDRDRTSIVSATADGGAMNADGPAAPEPSAPPTAEDVLTHRSTVAIEVPPPVGLPDPLAIPIESLFDDGVLFAVSKRPGIPVQPRGGDDLVNVLSALHARHRTDDPATDRVPHLAHRLDVDTSGVLLLLWDSKLSARVMRQFSTREVKKEYLAIVHGVPASDAGVVDTPLVSDPGASDGELMYRPGAGGKEVSVVAVASVTARHRTSCAFFIAYGDNTACGSVGFVVPYVAARWAPPPTHTHRQSSCLALRKAYLRHVTPYKSTCF